MRNFFISKKEDSILKIFKLINTSHKTTSLKDIENKISISNATSLRYLNELSSELHSIDSNINLLIKNNRYYISYPTRLSYTDVVFKLRKTYIFRSPKFQIMDLILKNTFNSIESIAFKINLSPASVRYYVKQLSIYFNQFNIKISFSKKHTLIGNPLDIRLLMLYTYLSIYKGDDLPDFPVVNLFDRSQLKSKLSYSQLHQIKIIEQITAFNLIQRKQALKIPMEFKKIFTIFNEVNTIKFNTIGISSDSLNIESLLFSFLLRCSVANYDSTNDRRNIARSLINLNSGFINKIKNLSLNFIDKFSLSPSLNNYLDIIYFLTIGIIYNLALSSKISKFDEYNVSFLQFEVKKIDMSPVIKKLEDFLALQKLNFPMLFNASSSPNLISLFFFLLDTNTSMKPLRITVQINRYYYGSHLINQSLKDVFGDAITIVNNDQASDLFISDSFENGNTHKNFFLFSSIFNPDDWSSLLEVTLHHIYIKRFYKNTK